SEECALYQVAVQGSDGAIRAISLYALGDLDDGYKNHELYLDTLDRTIAVLYCRAFHRPQSRFKPSHRDLAD
ncbi:MAG: hypothetical protein AAF902_26465, partial [Chloroflexota bacterium]